MTHSASLRMTRINFLKILDLNNLDNKKIAIIVICSLIAFYFINLSIIKLQNKGIKAKYTEIAEIRKKITDIRELERRKKEVKPGAAEVVKEIVSEDQITSLLQGISDLANKNNIKISQIRPSKDLKDEAPPASLKAVGIMLELSGNYFSLINFMNSLENDKILFIAQSLKIFPDSGDYLLQKINLTLKTYVKK